MAITPIVTASILNAYWLNASSISTSFEFTTVEKSVIFSTHNKSREQFSLTVINATRLFTDL